MLKLRSQPTDGTLWPATLYCDFRAEVLHAEVSRRHGYHNPRSQMRATAVAYTLKRDTSTVLPVMT